MNPDQITQANIALEKSAVILDELTQDLNSYKKPQFYNYDRLATLLDIAHDYVFEAQRYLKEMG